MNANASPVDDIIEFDPSIFNSPRTIVLTGGEIAITNSGALTINGTKETALLLSGNSRGRIFSMSLTAAPNSPVTLNNLVIVNGSNGAIYKTGGTLIINNSFVRNNNGVNGGGIFSEFGNLIINNSTFADNYAANNGGAVYFYGSSDAELTVTNSTFSFNRARASGGALYVSQNVNLVNTTIAQNSAEESGGGVATTLNGAFVYARNTIIARNTSRSGAAPDYSGQLLSRGFNLIGNASGTTISGSTSGNLLNVDPLFDSLAYHGGKTPTFSLQPGSPAIDAADPNNVLPIDQRGIPRPLDGDSNGVALPDIGAFEAGAKIVTKTADSNDGRCDADCSLREAIAEANGSSTTDAITFSTVFDSPQVIRLTSGQLNITNNGSLFIAGTGTNRLTISGNNTDRVFFITGGQITGAQATITINDLKISDGKIPGNGSGGGIYNGGAVVIINNLIVSNNSTNTEPSYSNSGGGIYNNGTMTVNDSVISGNFSSGQGGGMASEDGAVSGRSVMLTINNSFFGANNTDGSGGGIYCGKAKITNTTISNNAAKFGGGLIIGEAEGGLTNVTIANNTARQGYGGGVIGGGSQSAPLIIANSIINNNSAALGGGGLSSGDGSFTTIINSTISGNTVTEGSGGGIRNYRGTLSINNSVVNGNAAPAARGGGIYSESVNSKLNVTNSTISGNSAADGGGIGADGSVISVVGSTVSNNSAITGNGGGFYDSGAGSNISVTNSTVSDNRAVNGGGIYNSSYNTFNLVSSTISGNSATGEAGGIYNANTQAIVNVRNTIIGDNRTNGGAMSDFKGTLTSQGYNLIENTNGTVIAGTTIGNILGRDPQLAPLRSNGGATQTVALLPTSPAIDAGDLGILPATDQRGISRPQDGDLNGSPATDIGAYERQVVAFTATKAADTNDGVCNADCSLREAIAASNAAATPDSAVVFNPAFFNAARAITLTSGELQINSSGTFVINGPGANLLTISGNNQSRIFNIGAGANVSVNGVTVSGGSASNGGGGILNRGTLLLTNLAVSGNRAANFNGGGILNDGGILTVINSTVGNNTAGGGGGISNVGGGSANIFNSTINANTATSGGGIYNLGTLSVINSTVSGNSASLLGGGICNDGLFGAVLTVNSSTVVRNTAGNEGGGIGNFSGTVNARNSIFAGNTTNSGAAPDFRGALISQGYNLIENVSGATVNGTTAGNILGQDPLLAPLGNNGGATQTHALRANSPAIDKGSSSDTIFDQRGQSRPYDFPTVPNSQGGNGTDIGSFERQSSDLSSAAFFDFDGDGKSDVSVFRPENGTWYLQQSTNGFTGVQFGNATDRIVPADYDGDGRTDVAVFRSGVWYLQRSASGFTGIQFGAPDDIPVPADYDGDGRADIAVFRPSNGTWYLQRSQLGFIGIQFGQNGDKPVAADYDGDGKTDIAVNRGGTWYLNRSQAGFVGIQFGDTNDKSVPADYDGDGKADIAVFRPNDGTWYLQRSQLGFTGVQFGLGTDLPVPADYDGDGRTDIAVFRSGIWYLNRTAAGFTGVSFGTVADQPAPYAFIR